MHYHICSTGWALVNTFPALFNAFITIHIHQQMLCHMSIPDTHPSVPLTFLKHSRAEYSHQCGYTRSWLRCTSVTFKQRHEHGLQGIYAKVAGVSLDALQIQSFYSADVTQFPKPVKVPPNTSWKIRILTNMTFGRVQKEPGLFSLENWGLRGDMITAFYYIKRCYEQRGK